MQTGSAKTLISVLCSITTVADTLANMAALKYVDLGYTELSGAFDTACGLASTKQLQQLNIIGNALSGSIPSCITRLPQMVELHLDSNQLTGTIPAFSSSKSPLVYFTASSQVPLPFLATLKCSADRRASADIHRNHLAWAVRGLGIRVKPTAWQCCRRGHSRPGQACGAAEAVPA